MDQCTAECFDFLTNPRDDELTPLQYLLHVGPAARASAECCSALQSRPSL